jgi:hypothetical protein
VIRDILSPFSPLFFLSGCAREGGPLFHSLSNQKELPVNQTQTDLARLAKEMRVGLFATHSDFPAALRYAYEVIATLPKKDHAAAFTALHVVINTIANEIDPKE